MADLLALYQDRIAQAGFRDEPAQRAVLAALQQVLTDLETPVKQGFSLFRKATPAPVPGLYVWGGVGRGKSMLMDLFFEAAPFEGKRRVHFHAFMQEVHGALHEVRKTGVEDAIGPVADQIIKDLRLLCFDEMQITDITDAMIVGRLFEKLFAAGVAVVTTSNRPPVDLYKNGLNRALFLPFIDLLQDRMVVHEIPDGTDYRQDRLAGEARYFAPANEDARKSVETIWSDLTQGAEAAPLTLTVKGRAVVLPAFHNGSARAKFWDLCGVALGPADYLAVAEAVRVLILEDIPQLGRNNFNEAKRFVTLIDALYEGRVGLIATAAAVPERLYIEGEGSFEFERTASRLREMQSADWGLDGL